MNANYLRRRGVMSSPHLESSSGSIVTFDSSYTAKLKSLTVGIEPVQDLHGQSNPYPPGGGKNQANLNVTFPVTASGITITKNDDGSITINGTAEANLNISLMNPKSIANGAWTISGVPLGTPTGLNIWVRNSVVGSEYARTYNGNSGTVTITTGTIYVYCTIDNGTTLNNVKVFLQLEAGSTATPWSPYSNLCPITGWTGVDVTRCGKNLYKQDLDGYYLDVVTGLPVEANGYVVSEYIPVMENAPVYIPASGSARRWFYDVNKNPKVYLNNSNNQVYTPTENGYIRVTVAKTSPTYATYQIEYGSTGTSYEPYSNTTIPITWQTEAGTVYGGSDEIVSGGLSVDRAKVKLSDVDWNYTSSGSGRFYSGSLSGNIVYPSSKSIVGDIISDTLASVTANAVYGGTTGVAIDDGGNIWVYISGMPTNKEDFLDEYGNIELVYRLATPQPYQLDANTLSTLLGQNNIWATTGDTSVEYWKWNPKSEVII